MLTQQQPCACRHPHERAGHAAATGRRRFKLLGLHGLLGREHDIKVLNADISQLPPHDPCQPAIGRLFDIAQHELLCIALVAGAEGGHDGDAALLGGADKVNLT